MNTRTPQFTLALVLLAAVDAQADTLRDPTQPPTARTAVTTAVAIASLRVEAIFRHGDQMTAIVDGKLVRAGDRIGTAVIHDITSEGVRYTRGGRTEFSRLKSPILNVRRSHAAVEEQT